MPDQQLPPRLGDRGNRKTSTTTRHQEALQVIQAGYLRLIL